MGLYHSNVQRQIAAAQFRRTLIFFGALLVVMTGIQTLPTIFIRQTEVVTITQVGAARECRSRRTHRVFPKYRSEVPDLSVLGYCGLIMSDHGSFKLPETTVFSPFWASREELFDTLAEGCRFEVVVTGPGPELQSGRPMSNRNRTLVRATPVVSCDPTDEAAT